MMSRSGFSGKAGKGLGSGWLTSRGLDGEIGVESTRDLVSGAEDCNWCAFDGYGEYYCVTAESKVPSTA